MIAVRLRGAGFAVSLDDADRLVVVPASRLTDVQRAWIGEHVAVLKAELHAEAANDVPDEPTSASEASRWARFESVCLASGMTPGELARHFPTTLEREDIEESAADAIETFAVHMARVVLAERVRADVDGAAGLAPARGGAHDRQSWRTTTVTCGACLRFARAPGHAHDGHCTVGASNSARCWDNDVRTCERFEVGP